MRWKANPYHCHWWCCGCQIFKWKRAFDFRRSGEACVQCLTESEAEDE